MIYIYAVLTGCSAKCMYDILGLFRKIYKHKEWEIGIEDIVYWTTMSAFVFRAMFVTTDGNPRWFFVLGIVSGVLFEKLVKKQIKKVLDKIKKRL